MSLRSELFSTPLDILQMILDISTIRTNLSSLQNVVVRPEQHLEYYIRQGDAIIKSYLAEAYPATTSWGYTPWGSSPIVPINPQTGLIKNNGNVLLLNATISSTAKTAMWRLVCTSTGDASSALFRMESSLVGIQGTGKAFNATSASTNLDISIASTDWIDNSASQSGFNAQAGDEWLFSVIATYPLIWTISTNLATALTLNSLFLGQSQGESPSGSIFFNRAMALLEKLSKKQLAIDVGLSELDDLLPMELRYDIDSLGNDNTDYRSSEYDTYS